LDEFICNPAPSLTSLVARIAASKEPRQVGNPSGYAAWSAEEHSQIRKQKPCPCYDVSLGCSRLNFARS
jgi:hypothetical protein